MSFFRKFTTSGAVLFLMFSAVSFSFPAQASAAVAPGCDKSVSFLGLPAWYSYLDIGPETTGDGVTIDKCAVLGPHRASPNENELDWSKAAPLVGLAVLEIMLRIAGLVGFIFVIYGGFKYITSQGEPEKTTQSRQTITNSLIGIAISIIAAAVVSFIANTIWEFCN